MILPHCMRHCVVGLEPDQKWGFTRSPVEGATTASKTKQRKSIPCELTTEP
jgi:hypothetical protein